MGIAPIHASNDILCYIFSTTTNTPDYFDCDIDPCLWVTSDITCSNSTTPSYTTSTPTTTTNLNNITTTSLTITSISITNYPDLSGTLTLGKNGTFLWPSSLQFLHISNTNLSGNFDTTSLDNSPDLYYFNISNNHFTDNLIIDNSYLTNLNIFDASYNDFTSISIQLLDTLDTIYINDNLIKSRLDVSFFTGIDLISTFDFHNNEINGTLSIESMQLKYLDGSNNKLEYIEWHSSLFSNITYFDVSNNFIMNQLLLGDEIFTYDHDDSYIYLEIVNFSNNLFVSNNVRNYENVPNGIILDLRNNPFITGLEEFEGLKENVTLGLDVNVQCESYLCTNGGDIPIDRSSDICKGESGCVDTCRCENLTDTTTSVSTTIAIIEDTAADTTDNTENTENTETTEATDTTSGQPTFLDNYSSSNVFNFSVFDNSSGIITTDDNNGKVKNNNNDDDGDDLQALIVLLIMLLAFCMFGFIVALFILMMKMGETQDSSGTGTQDIDALRLDSHIIYSNTGNSNVSVNDNNDNNDNDNDNMPLMSPRANVCEN